MKALDLFAGTGWGVACKRLGIDEVGVEIMPAAIETRDANGMTTIYNDVWDGLLDPKDEVEYDILIASPPCQTFSVAGDGDGRKALNEVLAAVHSGAYKDAAKLKQLGEDTDMKTALVLTPLAHVYRDRPQYAVFEQVPPVLPVWEACAEEMRELGYSVWTGNLNAEQYGVPQVRKRAVLIAKWNEPVAPPTPTHSKFYSTKPEKLDKDVLPWRTMKDDLGWGYINRPAPTVGNSVGRGIGGGSGAQRSIARAHAAGLFMPSPRATSNAYSEITRMTPSDAGLIQSYPADFNWRGTKTAIYLQIGNAVPPRMAEAILSSLLAAE
jgi:DNA (cytosine-5)-methyltransferase 1